MIRYLCTRANQGIMLRFLTGWGRPLAGHLEVVWYEDIFRRRRVPAATYIFADLERLSPAALDDAIRLRNALRASLPPGAVVNDPTRALRRYALLRALREKGINDFGAWRLDDLPRPLRFPVFIRNELEHDGPLTALLDDAEALDAAIAGLEADGRGRAGRLAVEYGTAPAVDGNFRKYAVFIVGDALIPRHLHVGSDWIVKGYSRSDDPAWRDEELAFSRDNPHADQLARVRDIAGIDYGRIDYTLVGGRVQVFEINTHPSLVPRGASRVTHRTDIKQRFTERFVPALRALDVVESGEAAIPVRFATPGRGAAVMHDLHFRLKRRLTARIDGLVHHRGPGTGRRDWFGRSRRRSAVEDA